MNKGQQKTRKDTLIGVAIPVALENASVAPQVEIPAQT